VPASYGGRVTWVDIAVRGMGPSRFQSAVHGAATGQRGVPLREARRVRGRFSSRDDRAAGRPGWGRLGSASAFLTHGPK
jgi:hypothetical protein